MGTLARVYLDIWLSGLPVSFIEVPLQIPLYRCAECRSPNSGNMAHGHMDIRPHGHIDVWDLVHRSPNRYFFIRLITQSCQ